MNSVVHTYVVVELAKRNIGQTYLAAYCKTTPQMVNMVIRGVKTSAPIQTKIAAFFGFTSWELLYKAALKFQSNEVCPYSNFLMKEHA